MFLCINKPRFKGNPFKAFCRSLTQVTYPRKLTIYLLFGMVCMRLLACTMLNDPPVPPETDRQFLLSASDLNVLCKTAGDIALINAKNTLVRQYAAELVTFSSAMDRELSVMIRQKGITAKDISDTNVQKMDILQAKNTESFDPTFMEMTITAHNELVILYETEIESGKDPGVRRWAEAKLPGIRQNLESARLARKSI